MQLLGEQLIKNHTLALFELVKNSYDADAGKVSLLFLNIDEEDGAIEIEDDGFGMDFSTIFNIWMEPADGHKAEKREKGEKTKKGRLPIGEKGVGRFAVHRLGNQISLVTRASGSPEVFVDINWQSDIETHRYLDGAEIDITERKPEVFKGKKTGTRITISGLRQKWRRADVRSLYRSVFSMTAPVWDDGSRDFDLKFPIKTGDFKVETEFEPDKKWLEGLVDPEVIREQAMYRFDFLIDADGFHCRYNYKPLIGLQKDFKLIEPRDEPAIDNDTTLEFFKLRPPQKGEKWRGKQRKKRDTYESIGELLDELGVGPIRGRIAGFDLDKELLANYLPDDNLGLTRFLKRQGGMRVYRDNMRVYNYGEEGDDWLGLDQRRVQIPAKRLSNDLIMGEIHLRLKDSHGLTEQTNREGFIDNESYRELQYAVITALMRFEVEREKDKDIMRKCFASRNESKPSSKGKSTEEAISILKEKVQSKAPHKELLDHVNNVDKTYKETRDALLTAVGSGLGLSTVFHEIERGVRGMCSAIENNKPLDQLLEMAKSLTDLLKGATFLVSNAESETIKASELVQYALFISSERLEFHKIPYRNGFEMRPKLDFKIKGVRRMYTATLVNLIDNAIHWLKMSSNDEDRENQLLWIGPSSDLESSAIVVADSGPGFEDMPEDLVKPFFTRRSEGMGLGLYYANMVMKSHGGRLAFPRRGDVEVPRLCDGAMLAMVFKG